MGNMMMMMLLPLAFMRLQVPLHSLQQVSSAAALRPVQQWGLMMLMMPSSGSTLEVELVTVCSEYILTCHIKGFSRSIAATCLGCSRLTAGVVRILRVLCRLCTAACVPAMHDDSNHVYIVETKWHIVLAAAGAGSLLGSTLQAEYPCACCETCGR
jgi:hypothetical protein